MSFGKYQFHSWARRGISSQIKEKDNLGKSDGNIEERAQIPVKVKLNTGTVEDKDFSLFGPGDITGVSENMIIRSEPLNGIADYEPNLLPYVEFYDEDFPYRYTPASPSSVGKHLRPWLSLIVLKENEFVETQRREPLTSIRLINKDVLPPHDQLHLWCHVHSNLPHEESDFEVFLDSLEEDVKTDPDGLYSRIICPRKLESKTLYHAFLVPAFETGRLAGLGQPTAGIKAQKSSFISPDNEFPVYFRWYFRTGQNFDFEYLVKLLKPRPMDERVGVREMDCSRPAFIRADEHSEVRATNPEVLLLEGAMMAPDAKRSSLSINPQPFSEDIEKLVNLNRFQQENLDEDPFVTVPYYGMYHAMRRNNSLPGKREIPLFDPSSLRWYNELNKDPVYRVPAGFGKRVVQENQDKFMQQAWQQLGDVLEANKKMKLARFSREVMDKIYSKTLKKQANESYLALTNVLSSRVLDGNVTVRATLNSSLIENANLDPAFRRMTRMNTSIIKGLNQRINSREFSFDSLLKQVNKPNGISTEVKENFKAVPLLENINNFQPPSSINNIKVWSTHSNLQKDFAFNLPEFAGGLPKVQLWENRFPVSVIVPTTVQPVIARRPTVVSGRFQPVTTRPRGFGVRVQPRRRPTTIASSTTTPTVSTTLPPGAVIQPSEVLRIRNVVLVDTIIADQKFTTRQHTIAVKKAYKNASSRFQFQDVEAPLPLLKTADIRKKLDAVIAPVNSYKRLFDAQFRFPEGTLIKPKEEFLTAMAYPDIPEPTYKFLLDIDKEFLLPNLELIENNTLSLLKTNQKFIESYLVGLNHEMGQELLWREYPTDMRGSYFRQFWDVRGFVTPDSTPEDVNAVKDIKPIHRWSSSDRLGVHNARDAEGDTEQLVFVIRGDLLKKFPNTVIYAQKALKDGSKKIIRTQFENDGQKKEIRFPLFQAEISPDIKLLGFDLTINEASGEVKTPGFNDKQGWFFVIAEVPGEPRFGMDISAAINRPGDPDWNDLSWKHLPKNLKFVRANIKPTLSIPASIKEKWGASSADMAAILLQRPAMVAIHATEMLNQEIPNELFVGEAITLRSHLLSINAKLLDI